MNSTHLKVEVFLRGMVVDDVKLYVLQILPMLKHHLPLLPLVVNPLPGAQVFRTANNFLTAIKVK